MKIIINTQYGEISAYAEEHRRDPELIAAVENGATKVPASICAKPDGELAAAWGFPSFECLKVVEIPDENTDYYNDDYDGNERVVYVLNGKIHFAS